MVIIKDFNEFFRKETMDQEAETRDSIITSKDRKSIKMLTESVKQVVGKVAKVQHLQYKMFAFTFIFNTRNKQVDAEISGRIVTENGRYYFVSFDYFIRFGFFVASLIICLERVNMMIRIKS